MEFRKEEEVKEESWLLIAGITRSFAQREILAGRKSFYSRRDSFFFFFFFGS